APFFLVALAQGAFEATYSTVDRQPTLEPPQLLAKLLQASAAVWFYVGKALWPVNLCFDYGPWRMEASNPAGWLALFAGLAFTAGLLAFRRHGTRPALLAWAYFCVALAPAL